MRGGGEEGRSQGGGGEEGDSRNKRFYGADPGRVCKLLVFDDLSLLSAASGSRSSLSDAVS